MQKATCPQCGEGVKLVPTDDGLLLEELNGLPHVCYAEVEPTEAPVFELKPIGQKILGCTIQDFNLRGRIASITLSEGSIFEISAGGKPLNLRLVTKDGLFEE